MNGKEASDIVAALVFGAQKARSNLTESMGDDEATQGLLADLEPFLFGSGSVLPRLLEWQGRIRTTGEVRGADLFNFLTLLDRRARAVLMCAAAGGFDLPEEPEIAWMAQTWRVDEAIEFPDYGDRSPHGHAGQ